jgi:hypothetical protein
MDGRKNNSGTKGNKGGRPPKADEQKLIETLKPLMPAAYKALESALKEEQSWAVKLAMEYFYGKPHQTVDNNIKVEEIKRPEWFDEE